MHSTREATHLKQLRDFRDDLRVIFSELLQMRRRTLPLELLLLAVFTIFLLYPLLNVFPAVASDQEYEVRLLSLGDTSEATDRRRRRKRQSWWGEME
jgi:hypothetical protein